jgi:hypothetical protein
MNTHNKSLGKRSTKGPALNTGNDNKIKSTLNQTSREVIPKVRAFNSDFIAFRNGGLAEMKSRLMTLKAYLSDPTRKPSARVVKFVQNAIEQYELAVKASLGMPTYSDSVTLQHEAPKDIPTLPLDGYQLVSRTCLVQKLATSGTAAGGFYTDLKGSDLAPFTTNPVFRLKKVTSWTGTTVNTVGSGFAGVSVPAGLAAGGTEVTPIWSENWTPVGQGYAGVVTQYPLGDFPQISNTDTGTILNHYTSLGGTGGVTGVPVIFHVEIECLI